MSDDGTKPEEANALPSKPDLTWQVFSACWVLLLAGAWLRQSFVQDSYVPNKIYGLINHRGERVFLDSFSFIAANPGAALGGLVSLLLVSIVVVAALYLVAKDKSKFRTRYTLTISGCVVLVVQFYPVLRYLIVGDGM